MSFMPQSSGDPWPYSRSPWAQIPLTPFIPSGAVEGAIKDLVHQSIRDLADFELLKALIEHHIDETRGLTVYSNDAGSGVHRYGIYLFESVSWIACVEWSLKQPMLEAKETP